MGLKDSRIIELFQERSELAIRELSRKYGTLCTRIAKNILNSSRDAEECVNDAYLAVWDTIPPKKPDPLCPYLCGIVRNLAIKKYHANTARKRNSHYDAALDELEECIPSGRTVESELSAKELTRMIDLFLDEQDRDSRILFVRRYWYSDSVQELAERFHISRNNVSVRLARIRRKLKDYLKKEGIEV